MDKRVAQLGNDVVYNPPGDGDCFYASAAKGLRIETQGLKNERAISSMWVFNL